MNALEAIARRQGVLRFKTDPVKRELIEQVLLAAIAAPSPANTQPWEFIVVDDPSISRAIARYLVETQADFVFRQLLKTPEPFINHLLGLYEALDQVPCFIVLCRNQRTGLGTSGEAVVRDWDLCSLGAAIANLMTAATALSLGTRWFGNPMLNPGSLQQMLSIPEEVEIIAVIPLGYHDEQIKDRPVQSLEVHFDFQQGDKHKLAALLQGKLALADVVSFNTYESKQSP